MYLVPDEAEPLDVVEEEPGHGDDHEDQEGHRHEDDCNRECMLM